MRDDRRELLVFLGAIAGLVLAMVLIGGVSSILLTTVDHLGEVPRAAAGL